MTNTTYYFDMDGVIADFHTAYKKDKATALKRDTMANLKPFKHNIKVMQQLVNNGKKVYILTKAANENGKNGKLDWIEKNLPFFNRDNFICIVGKGNKVDFIKEDGVLIDDDKKNTAPWIKAGHQAITLVDKGEPIRIEV